MSWTGAVKTDPFLVLGVEQDADDSEIKAAYRRLAKSCHPDAAPGDAAAARRFHAITNAYDALMKRRTRARPRRPVWRPATRTPKNGAHLRLRVVLTMEEAVTGCARQLEIARGMRALARFPSGCEDGTVLRLKGWGGKGRDGGRDGDALIEVAIAPHRLFRLDGADAHLLFKTHPRQLASGAVVDAPTPTGPVKLSIPPRSRPGMVLRVRGKGLPARQGRPAGDLYVTLKVGDSTGPIRPRMETYPVY
ncbi:MAG: DnaJ domain-containing protein [Caulobacterales bacterium]|nr:DnaJ domain-containing protein [Caulobacterales bacterium]